MKRIAVTFAVCIGMIVLTNCQQTGGMDPFTQSLVDDFNASTERSYEHYKKSLERQSIERRLATLEEQVGDMAENIEHLRVKILVLESTN